MTEYERYEPKEGGTEETEARMFDVCKVTNDIPVLLSVDGADLIIRIPYLDAADGKEIIDMVSG